MQSLYDYKKFAILYVDDEEKSLKNFSKLFSDTFRIYTATNAADAWKIIEEHGDEIGILMSDQRMPGERGVQLLEKTRRARPKIVRILVTAFTDFEAAIEAVNTGAIYRYVTKPWDTPVLEFNLKRALEFFMVQRERDSLLREKLSVLQHIMITDRVVSLGILAAGLGHHLRNSLVAVRTFLDLAPDKMKEEKVDVEDLRNPNFWQDFYDHVQAQVRRIMEMLSDLGLAAQVPRGELEDKVDLKEVANSVIERFSPQLQARGLKLKTDFSSELPELRVDRRKFQRLFELLIRDELVNVPEGGAIELSAQPKSSPEGAKLVELVLTDNGPGLPKEALRSLFDPFYVRSDHPQEFGLNLMACYFIVFHHGGNIEVRSNDHRGTTFVITLPVEPPPLSTMTEKDFLGQALTNEALWEKLISGA